MSETGQNVNCGGGANKKRIFPSACLAPECHLSELRPPIRGKGKGPPTNTSLHSGKKPVSSPPLGRYHNSGGNGFFWLAAMCKKKCGRNNQSMGSVRWDEDRNIGWEEFVSEKGKKLMGQCTMALERENGPWKGDGHELNRIRARCQAPYPEMLKIVIRWQPDAESKADQEPTNQEAKRV